MMHVADATRMRREWNLATMTHPDKHLERDQKFVAFIYNKGELDIPQLLSLEKEYAERVASLRGHTLVFHNNRKMLIGGHIDYLVRTSKIAAQAAGCFMEITIEDVKPSGMFQ